ncbi:MAG TPA: amidohydrolase family protein [bacterium]|uniref:Amidohydrolase n=1 Tax=candidate division TA06 bacterium ADurb.Bin417 TaxID=1852828 RepID=A0A1V5MK61_UNCT6|nr:MAG: Amidohydrolase [candidate division TA06 bacterium ADurb.Bin417]HNQ34676.1 amidohydrolase family protein [bacterium]HNS48970.1 amidohydrolase family protein [bacterium]
MKKRGSGWILIGLILLTLVGLPKAVVAFDKSDLPRMEKRLVFYTRGSYALSCSQLIKLTAEEQAKKRFLTVNFYYIGSRGWHDPLFNQTIQLPVEVKETPEAVVLTSPVSGVSYKVSAAGLEIDKSFKFENENSGGMLWYIHPDNIRFDDAVCYNRSGEKLVTRLFKPYSITPADSVRDDTAAVLKFFEGQADFTPDFVVRTEEGLWTLWDFRLEGDLGKVKTFFANQDPVRPMIGSPSTLLFYNTASGVQAGTALQTGLKLRVVEDQKFPWPVKAASASVTLIDTHVHLTTLTDLRDAALMARKHGLRYCILSFLYDERPYGRLFEGDPETFKVMERYPDIFYGFGFIQLNTGGYPGFPRSGPDSPEKVTEQWQRGCKGIKIIEKWTSVALDDPQFDPLYKRMEELSLPLAFHTEPEGRGSDNIRAARVAEKFPGLPVIMAHLSTDTQLEQIIPYFKRLPNLYIQHMHLSTVRTAEKKTALQKLIGAGLIRKVVFGSDVQDDYGTLLSAGLFARQLLDMGVSQADVDAVMFRTAEELIRKVKPVPAGQAISGGGRPATK